jgi:hypothetical protein
MQNLAFSVAYRLKNSIFAARKCEFINIKPGKPRQMSFRACLAVNNPPLLLGKASRATIYPAAFLDKTTGLRLNCSPGTVNGRLD